MKIKVNKQAIDSMAFNISQRLKTHAEVMKWDPDDMPLQYEVKNWITDWFINAIDREAINLQESLKQED